MTAPLDLIWRDDTQTMPKAAPRRRSSARRFERRLTRWLVCTAIVYAFVAGGTIAMLFERAAGR